jgi:hypothetical protein
MCCLSPRGISSAPLGPPTPLATQSRPLMPLAVQSRPPTPAQRSGRNTSIVRWRSGSAERRNDDRKKDDMPALDASGSSGRRRAWCSMQGRARGHPPLPVSRHGGSASLRRRCLIQGLRQATSQFTTVGAPCRGSASRPPLRSSAPSRLPARLKLPPVHKEVPLAHSSSPPSTPASPWPSLIPLVLEINYSLS